MFLTIWCILFVFGTVLFFGTPLASLLKRGQPLDEEDWLLTPFLGMACVVLFLQNLVYLNCPIKQTAWVAWSIGAIGWLACLWRGSPLGSLRSFPGWAYLAAVAVFALHGFGLFAVQANYYVGHGWPDQIIYNSLALFFTEYPTAATLNDTNIHVAVGQAITLKNDRIGQSVLHGFLAYSLGVSPKIMFEPLILMTPPLLVLALNLLGRRLGLTRGWALVASVAGGVIPAVATIHLDSFLSHALGLPFLILVPVVILDWYSRPTVGVWFRAALIGAALVSIYTEFSHVFLAILLIHSLGYAILGPRSAFVLAGGLLIAAAPVLLNPGFAERGWDLIRRVTAEGACQGTYPWGYRVEGWARIWLGDWVVKGPELLRAKVRVLTIFISALAFIGWYRGWRQAWRQTVEGASRSTSILFLSVGVLALLPLALVIRDEYHEYQVFKLLLTMGPLFMLGLAILPATLERRWRVAGAIPLVGMAVFGGINTGRMVADSYSATSIARTNAPLLQGADMMWLQDEFERMPPSAIVIAHSHPLAAAHQTQLASKHDVYLTTPSFLGSVSEKTLSSTRIYDLANLPERVNLLTMKNLPFLKIENNDLEDVWTGEVFELKRTRSRQWALLLSFTNLNGVDSNPNQAGFWIGDEPTRMSVIAGCAGRLVISGEFVRRGLSGWDLSHIPIEIQVNTAKTRAWRGDGPNTLAIAIPAGQSEVSLRTWEDMPIDRGPYPRPRVLGIRDVEFRFEAGESVPTEEPHPALSRATR